VKNLVIWYATPRRERRAGAYEAAKPGGEMRVKAKARARARARERRGEAKRDSTAKRYCMC
tara:strand:- start:577 stop:759 length:183 start_codon:yes stop_codon:yes gene_type:complete